MSNNLALQLTIQAKDRASGDINKVMKAILSGANDSNRALGKLTKAMQGYATGTDAAAKGSENLLATIRRIANERGPVALTNGMRAVTDQATRAHRALESVVKAARAASSIAAGATAAGYVIAQPAKRTMDYGVRLAHMANTAFSDRDTVGRIAGKRELDAAIVNAVRVGGGNRETAAGALDNLIASGSMSGKAAMALLPTLMRGGTAANADPNELANIAIRGMQTFKIAPEHMGRAIDMGITGGQEGGFELKDMSKWLPQQMAYARSSGMSGLPGLAKLIAANQAVAITAGSKDEAGNNLLNLLAKINSQDTANDAKKQGINLSGSLAAMRGKGMDSLDGFVSIVDHVVGKDKRYQSIQNQLKTAKGDDRKQLLESQADILQGSSIGKIIQDRQAMLALVAIMSNREYMTSVQNKVLHGEGAANKNYDVVSNEAGYKVEQAKNEAVIATQTAFERLTPLIGQVADGMTEHAREYPLLTAATTAATTALTALAAAAGAASLTSILTNKPGTLGPGTATGAGGISLAEKVGLAGGAGAAGIAALPLAAMYGVSEWAGDTSHDEERVGGLQGISGALERILNTFGINKDRDIEERRRRNREELDGGSQTINVQIDGKTVASVVNDYNRREASRN